MGERLDRRDARLDLERGQHARDGLAVYVMFYDLGSFCNYNVYIVFRQRLHCFVNVQRVYKFIHSWHDTSLQDYTMYTGSHSFEDFL